MMNEEKIVEVLFDIKTQLAEISANQKNFQTVLTNHENRLMSLEGHKSSSKDEDLKSQLLKMLAKGLIIGLTIIGSLTGASGLLKQVMNSNQAATVQETSK